MTATSSVRTATGIADPSNPANVLVPNIVTATAIVPSDSAVLTPPALGLYIGSAGDVVVRMYGNQQVVTFTGVPVGTALPIVVDQVQDTNTTASKIIAFTGQITSGFSFIVTEAGNFLITEAGDDLITES